MGTKVILSWISFPVIFRICAFPSKSPFRLSRSGWPWNVSPEVLSAPSCFRRSIRLGTCAILLPFLDICDPWILTNYRPKSSEVLFYLWNAEALRFAILDRAVKSLFVVELDEFFEVDKVLHIDLLLKSIKQRDGVSFKCVSVDKYHLPRRKCRKPAVDVLRIIPGIQTTLKIFKVV